MSSMQATAPKLLQLLGLIVMLSLPSQVSVTNLDARASDHKQHQQSAVSTPKQDNQFLHSMNALSRT